MTAGMDHFTRSDLTFPVRDSGPAGGVPVVLLHGFPQTAASYDRVVDGLNRLGLRTLVPTQRGYAATARPNRRRDYRISELAADVVGLIGTAGVERVHLVGHDWGGAVAWAVAGLQPDRVQSLTVLSTPHPAAMRESLLRSSQARKSWYMAMFQLPALPERVLSRDLARQLRSSGLPADPAAEYAAAMAEPSALTGALNWYRGLPFSLRPKVPDIAVPTTYVWGRTDFALGAVAARRTGAHVVADYRFVELDAGHWLPETHPAEVIDAITDRIDRAR
jgi:pimeloyl-ACP methyl ester carboxylesterase